jgi:hypothetical protein
MPVRIWILTAIVLALLPALTAAADPPPARSITALATANIDIDKHVAQNDAAIKAAIDAARRKAGPAALTAAQAEAQRLAAAAGFTLGALISVAELPPSPFGPFSYGLDGTFGPGKWCGTIRTPIFRHTKSGRRVFTHRFRKHHGCRVPAEASTTVSATYAAQ